MKRVSVNVAENFHSPKMMMQTIFFKSKFCFFKLFLWHVEWNFDNRDDMFSPEVQKIV